MCFAASVAVSMMTPREVAKILNLSVPTIHRLIATGELRASKIGNRLRIASDDVVALVANSQVEPKT